jgi:hypothetical protein
LKDSSSPSKTNNDAIDDIDDTTDRPAKSSSSHKSMVVSVNGEFKLQNEDEYTAKRQTKFNDDDDDDDKHHPKVSTTNPKVTYMPAPPTEAKPQQNSNKPPAPHRSYPSATRPKSSDIGKRTENSNSATRRSLSANKNRKDTNDSQRPKRYIESILMIILFVS